MRLLLKILKLKRKLEKLKRKLIKRESKKRNRFYLSGGKNRSNGSTTAPDDIPKPKYVLHPTKRKKNEKDN